MKQKITIVLACCIFSLGFFASPALSCVGRILTLSINESMEQKVVGHLLATYIRERTGTTVNIQTAPDVSVCEEQIKKCEADIFINYLDVGLASIYGSESSGAEQETYGLVKQHYIDTFDMVWLKPLGYKGPVAESYLAGDTHTSLAIPVTTREVLNRFPVLDRVINKLGGRIDQATLTRLASEAENNDVETVVKQFLKDNNLI